MRKCAMCGERLEEDSYIEIKIVTGDTTTYTNICSLECAKKYYSGEETIEEKEEMEEAEKLDEMAKIEENQISLFDTRVKE